MGKVGSFLTCSIHWLLFGEWRSLSLCSRAYEQPHTRLGRAVIAICGAAHVEESWRHWRG
jgi:hypothetical protein